MRIVDRFIYTLICIEIIMILYFISLCEYMILLFSLADGTRIILLNHKSYFYSDEKITFMVTREGQHLPIDFSLDKLNTLLVPRQFFRANRQYLVGFEAIQNVFTHFKGKLKLELLPKNKHEVFVSGDRMTDFKEWLGK